MWNLGRGVIVRHQLGGGVKQLLPDRFKSKDEDAMMLWRQKRPEGKAGSGARSDLKGRF